jgi:DNA helicase-2/ATP-dependent DNA helicase PcrA
MKANPQQQRIIDKPIDATVKVVAGAGTGKTGVLVHRYIKFVIDDGIAPDHLLALTFTKKAAAEMQGRVFTEIAGRGDRVTLRALYGAWIMNFHQFAYRVIKENAAEFGIDPDTAVASEVDLERARRSVQKKFEAGTIKGLPESYEADMPPPNRMDQYFDRCMKVVGKARGTLWTHELLLDTIGSDDVPDYGRYVQTVIALWHAYEDELHSQLLLDFDDLIRTVVDEFARNDNLRRSYQQRFAHILVDEFQDTSEAQNELLRLISGDNFPRTTVVGDEKQSIYRWRDARVENIREFEGEEEPLTLNYRSTQGILDGAFRLIAGDEYFGQLGESIHLKADRGSGDIPLCLFHPPDESEPSRQQEARALGQWILAVTQGAGPDSPFEYYRDHSPHLGFGDVAILMRSLKPASGLPHYETELQRLRIPYAIVGGVSAIEERTLELLKNVLRLLVYADDVTSLLGVLESKPFDIGDDALMQMFRRAERPHHVWSRSPVFRERGLLSDEVLSAVTAEGARERLVSLRGFLEKLDHSRSHLDLPAFVTEALASTQFYYRLFDEGGDLRLVGSLSRRIFELIEHLAQKGEPNVAALIEAVETLLQRKQFGEQDAPYVPEGRVVIMTQHQAKGLQFPAVVIPGIKRQLGRGDGFYLVKKEGLYKSDWENWGRGSKNCEARDIEKVEHEQEERCLLYVAMTRAEDHLFMSSSRANGLDKNGKPSLFTSVVEGLRQGGVHFVECRDAKPAAAIDTEAQAAATVEPAVLESLLDEWHRGKERVDEARAFAKPAAGGLQFISWRGLQSFERCPLQYYYRHVAAVSEDVTGETAADSGADFDGVGAGKGGGGTRGAVAPDGMSPAEFGSVVHRFLYERRATEANNEDERRRLAEDLMGRFDVPEKARDKAVAKTLSIAQDCEQATGDTAVVQLEWPLRKRVGDIVCHGVIDRVDRGDDGLRIVDYKVGTPNDEYHYQIKFYKWLSEGMLEEGVAAGCVMYLGHELLVDKVDVAATAHIDTSAEELADAVATNTYHASPGRVCQSCDYNNVCPYSVVERNSSSSSA